jgi:hypothetical protein
MHVASARTSVGAVLTSTILAGVVVAASAYGLVVLRPGPHHAKSTGAVAAVVTPTSTPPISTPGGQQANLLTQFLDESAAARVTITPAIQDATRCRGPLPVDATIFQRAAAVRRRLVGQFSSIDWNTLPSGSVLRTQLTDAFVASATADRDYQAWAVELRRGRCHPGDTSGEPAYGRALRDDRRASAAKRSFVRTWNPVAASYGLPAEVWFSL